MDLTVKKEAACPLFIDMTKRPNSTDQGGREGRQAKQRPQGPDSAAVLRVFY